MNARVIDQAVPEELFAQFQQWLETIAMLPGWRASRDTPGSFWHRNFVLSGIFKHHYSPHAVSPNLNHEALLAQGHALSAVAKHFSEQYFEGLAFSRVWINVQNFGEDAAVHRDFEREFDAHARAAIWYPVPAWDVDWGGDFALFDEHGEFTQCIAVKPNRLVVFDGNPRHAARPLSRYAQQRRVAVVFGREVVA